MFWRRRAAASQKEIGAPAPQVHPVGGYLGHHGLSTWWDSTFSDEERSFLESYLAPLLSGNASWRTGTPPKSTRLDGSTSTPARFLSMLAGFLKRSDRAHLAVRLLEKARSYDLRPIDEHFATMAYIEVRYKQRESDPQALTDVIAACERMIAMSAQLIVDFERKHLQEQDRAAELYSKIGEPFERVPFTGVPNNPFFKRLAIIFRKQGRKEEASEIEALHDRIWLPHTIDFRRARLDEGMDEAGRL